MKGKQWILAAMAAAALVMPLSSYAAAAPQASPAAVTQKAQVPAPAYADSTLQATRYGLLQGAQEGDDFVWRGVPYGQAERWKTPENPSSWTGVRDALKTGPMGNAGNGQGREGRRKLPQSRYFPSGYEGTESSGSLLHSRRQ